MYEEIRKGLIKALKKVKDIDVIFIKNEDFDEVSEYFFVVIKPISKDVETVNMYRESFLIDIMYDKEGASIHELMLMAEKIDDYFKPVIYFDTFSVSVNATIKVIDNILHYTFDFDKTYTVIRESKEDMMESLEIK